MPASNTRIAAITATMYGSPIAEASQKTTAAARTAMRMPITSMPPFRLESAPVGSGANNVQLQAERGLPGGVAEASVVDHGEGRERVILGPPVRPDMAHSPPPNEQRIGHKPPVTAPPVRLGAHDRGGPLAG